MTNFGVSLTVFYPGCGHDFFYPIMIAKELFTGILQLKIIYADISYDRRIILSTLKMKLPVTKIIQNQHLQYYSKIIFSSNETLFELKAYDSDVFLTIPYEILLGYDLYVERAFEVYRSEKPFFINKLIALLKPGGFIVSDYGFYFHKDLDQILIPKHMNPNGFYTRFEVCQKKNSSSYFFL